MTTVPSRLTNLLYTASRTTQIVLRPVPLRTWLTYKSSKALKLLLKDEESARCISCAAAAHKPMQFMASEEELKKSKVIVVYSHASSLHVTLPNIVAPASPHRIQGCHVVSNRLYCMCIEIQRYNLLRHSVCNSYVTIALLTSACCLWKV